MVDIINRLQDKVASAGKRKAIVDFERNPDLKGLLFLNPLYDSIASRQTICLRYRSFNAREPKDFIIFPYLLKEYRNRWFVFGSRAGDLKIFNLALDRIVDFHVCPDIPYQDNPDFSDNYFDDIIGVTKHDRLEKNTIEFVADNTCASYILTKPFHSKQKLVSKNKSDGSMTFKIEDIIINPELEKQFLSYGADIRIISPQSLVRKIKKTFQKGLAKYQKSI